MIGYLVGVLFCMLGIIYAIPMVSDFFELDRKSSTLNKFLLGTATLVSGIAFVYAIGLTVRAFGLLRLM